MVGWLVGWVLLHINDYWLFNRTYIYIKYWYDLWIHFVDNILKEPDIYFGTQLNGFRYCYITATIWYQSFTHCYISPIDWTQSDSTTPGQSEPVCNSPKLKSWCLTIRLFNVISRTLVGRRLFSCSRCILQPQLSGLWLVGLGYYCIAMTNNTNTYACKIITTTQ